MTRWVNSIRSHIGHFTCSRKNQRFASRRWMSTMSDIQTVETRCGSSGYITISLHSIENHLPSTPLLIYIPPFPSVQKPAVLPPFIHKYPTAVIHYRWIEAADAEVEATCDFRDTPLHWPTPVHDVAFGYSWIVQNLIPDGRTARRDIFVYSSHLGASLAASLALTEAHPHQRFAVRGFATYNGIYNWTMFLPDHPIYKKKSKMKGFISNGCQEAERSPTMHSLRSQMPGLFHKPRHLFDPFASPALMFHSPGLHPPRTFTQSHEYSTALDSLASGADPDDEEANPLGIDLSLAPRRSHLIFPPRTSTLKIPDSLLLFSHPPPQPTQRKQCTAKKPSGLSFQLQAVEFAELMRKSVERLEVRERRVWTDDWDMLNDMAEKRVKLYDVGEEVGPEEGEKGSGIELTERGCQMIEQWLDERF